MLMFAHLQFPEEPRGAYIEPFVMQGARFVVMAKTRELAEPQEWHVHEKSGDSAWQCAEGDGHDDDDNGYSDND